MPTVTAAPDPLRRPNSGFASQQIVNPMDDFSFDSTVHEAHGKKVVEHLKQQGKYVEPDFQKIRDNEKQYKGITKDLSTMGLQQWMAIILATLQHQDPDDPLKPHEVAGMMSQMGMATGVARASEKMDDILASMNESLSLSSSANTGKLIEAETNQFRFDGKSPAELGYELPQAVGRVTLTIFDQNGNMVHSKTIDKNDQSEGLLPGRNSYTWDGKDKTGANAEAGFFKYVVSAKDNDGRTLVDDKTGRAQSIKTFSSGTMEACYLGEGVGGKQETFVLMDGIKIPLDKVRAIKGFAAQKAEPEVKKQKSWADKVLESQQAHQKQEHLKRNLLDELKATVTEVAPISEGVGTNNADH